MQNIFSCIIYIPWYAAFENAASSENNPNRLYGASSKKKLRSILEVQSKCSHIMHSIHGELHLGKAFKELY